MITDFGKFCRKLRIDHDELLLDMAKKLGVTPSYLSAVEKGKRNIPMKWEELINTLYFLSPNQKAELSGLMPFTISFNRKEAFTLYNILQNLEKSNELTYAEELLLQKLKP